MELQEAIRERHSVRQYINKPLTEGVVAALNKKIHELNKEGGLISNLLPMNLKLLAGFYSLYKVLRYKQLFRYHRQEGRQYERSMRLLW